MLVFNGKKYAKNDKEFTSSLFTSQTCNGYYKTKKNGSGTTIYNMQKEIVAFIVHNNRQGYFVVSATKHNDGKTYYMYGLSSLDEVFLGLDGKTGYEEEDIIKQMQEV